MARKLYSQLDPRRELEQQVALDLNLALVKRGASVQHHGTVAANAPASAPGDITVDWQSGTASYRLLVEVAKRRNESEYTSLVEHLNAATADHSRETNVLYSGLATSARMVRLIRNENKRRKDSGIRGRIIFVALDDLQDLLEHWRAFPREQYPPDGLIQATALWCQFTDDLHALQVIQQSIFGDWTEKSAEISREIEQEAIKRQERLRKEIVNLENKLRERGITGSRAHKILIYLFFLALYEDRRGVNSRITPEGFSRYKEHIDAVDRQPGSEYYDRTIHRIYMKDIMGDQVLCVSGMLNEYEPILLPDDFIRSTVLPVFEGYVT